ncbi:MAG: SDR family oxidoreductase [Planctomycetota bacterium]
MRYEDKVTIVTGGSKGIGEGCVRVFVQAGARVEFCARGEEAGRALESEVNRKVPGRATFRSCDVSKTEDIVQYIDAVAAEHGRIDCLINNAGWHPPHVPIDDFTEQDFRDLLELNLVSMFTACRRALPHLRLVQGNIINLSSLVGSMGQLHATTYVATKGAITAFTKALAVDEAAHGVRVNCVSPGNVWTPLWAEAVAQSPDPEAAKRAGNEAQLLGRMGTLEEAGKLCLFLAAEATFTTGVDHILSGGAELAYGRKTRV